MYPQIISSHTSQPVFSVPCRKMNHSEGVAAVKDQDPQKDGIQRMTEFVFNMSLIVCAIAFKSSMELQYREFLASEYR